MNSTSPSEGVAKAIHRKAQTSPPQNGQRRSRQLLVDISVIVQSDAHTGIQRVVRALLGALMDADLDGYVVRPIYATRKDAYAYAPSDAPLFAGRSPAGPAPSSQVAVCDGDIFLGLDLAANILPRHRRQIRQWRRCGCQIAVVIYDLLPEQRPDWFNPKTRRNYRRWLRVVTAMSDKAICISRDVAEDLKRWVSARPWRGNRRLEIDWMRLGGDIIASAPTTGLPSDATALLAHFSERPMLLVVGTIEPRKGHACLLPAFEMLWQTSSSPNLMLVFVGRPGWKTEALQARMRSHPEAGQRFFWFDNASDEFLGRLYDTASGVIVPSFAEGFGLPLVEAAAHGTPVLARNLPVFKAMNLANVTYFTQDEPAILAASIEKWLDSAHVAALPGEENAPTWNDSLDDLLQCLSIPQ